MTEGEVQILPSGDSALLVKFGEKISESDNRKVAALQNNLEMKKIHGVTEVIPAYASLLVVYNPLMIPFKTIYGEIRKVLEETGTAKGAESSRKIVIPVCYDATFGPDLREVSEKTGLSTDEIIKIHTAATYRVFMLGFTPGFPYLGKTDERIACPRKDTPRQVIAEGSVGLAGRQTGIYPIESPGGWQIIGRTPLKIFDPGKKNIFLFQAGDLVRFKAIGIKEFETVLMNPASWKE